MTLREKLDLIDGWLCETGSDARKLGDILSAIRGPDVQNSDHVKHDSTNVIRRVAFPLAWGRAGGGLLGANQTGWDTYETAKEFVSPRDYNEKAEYMTRHNGVGWHFMNHVEQAAKALGLMKGDVA